MESIKLKDDTDVTLHKPVVADAEALLVYLDAVRNETEFIAWGAGDTLPTVEQERDWIAKMNADGCHQVMAEVDGAPVGMASVGPVSPFARERHQLTLGISIRRAFWGRGLGRALMERVLRWARAQPHVRLVTLGVYGDNLRAQRLYASCGFIENGRVPGAIARADGSFVDDVRMSCWVGKPEPAAVAPEHGLAPVEMELKSGQAVTIRAATPDDAQPMLDYMRGAIEEVTRFIMTTPEEFTYTLAQERAVIAGADPAAGELWLMVFDGERVVGSLNCGTVKRSRRAHVGELGMTLHADYRGQGVGTAMLSALIGWAEQHPALELLRLSVYADNLRALALYRRCGFAEAGRVPGLAKFGEGDYRDEITMWRSVSGQNGG